MNRQPCNRWKDWIDGDFDAESVRQHVEGCVDCQTMLAAETQWEEALRTHADSFGDFEWSPDLCDRTSPSVVARQPPNWFGWFIALAATLLVGFSGWAWWSRANQDANNHRAAIRDQAVLPTQVEAEPKTSPPETVVPTTESASMASSAESPSVTLRSVQSSSHVPVNQPVVDDGLTFVMFYPRLANKAQPRVGNQDSEL